jgi:hypothetical protein
LASAINGSSEPVQNGGRRVLVAMIIGPTQFTPRGARPMRPDHRGPFHVGILAGSTLADPRTSFYLLATMYLIVFASVALPAVWSGKSARRKAAASVLQQLLDFLRGFRSP